MKSSLGKNLKVTIWGGSHEPAIGVDIENLPKGTEIDMTELEAFLKRRAPGNSPFATKRKEPDIPVPVSGLVPLGSVGHGKPVSRSESDTKSEQRTVSPPDTAPGAKCASGTTSTSEDKANAASEGNPTSEASTHIGANAAAKSQISTSDMTNEKRIAVKNAAPNRDHAKTIVADDVISLEIKNTDTRSSDYKALRAVPRPGHADYTARLRYGDSLNMAGGGPFSARMTAPLCIAGGIALQILARRGVSIGAHIYSIGSVKDTPFDPVNVTAELLQKLKQQSFPVIADAAGKAMQDEILAAKAALDSVGGVVEVCALNVPAGIGGAMYDGLESALAPVFFGIPAVKGVEFGAGFGATLLKGSENNDAFYYDNNQVKTRTNNHGGILGGITTGMPLTARLAFKPTPSIAAEQDSVDLDNKTNTKLIIKGRHDPCVVVRAVPIAEAALALGILDCMMEVQK